MRVLRARLHQLAKERPTPRRAPPAAARSAPSTAASGSAPTTSPRTGSPTTAPASSPTTSTPCSTATSTPVVQSAVDADEAARLAAVAEAPARVR